MRQGLGINWLKVGAALAASPHVQRWALTLAFGAAAVGVAAPDCEAIEQEAARRLWAVVQQAGAVSVASADVLPAASESDVFEVLAALSGGLSVPEIAFALDMSVAEVWAVVASSF